MASRLTTGAVSGGAPFFSSVSALSCSEDSRDRRKKSRPRPPQEERLTAIEDLALGSGVGDVFPLLGQDKSLFDHEPLEGSQAIQIGRWHERLILRVRVVGEELLDHNPTDHMPESVDAPQPNNPP